MIMDNNYTKHLNYFEAEVLTIEVVLVFYTSIYKHICICLFINRIAYCNFPGLRVENISIRLFIKRELLRSLNGYKIKAFKKSEISPAITETTPNT